MPTNYTIPTVLKSRSCSALLALVIPPLVCLIGDLQQPLAFGLLLSTILLWTTELIPLAVTALLIPTQAVLFGLLSPAEAFRSFGSPVIFLLIGVFLLVEAVRKQRLDRRLALMLLTRKGVCGSPERILLFITVTTWLFGLWLSNTATCSVLVPIVLGVVAAMEPHVSSASAIARFRTRALLTCAFVPSIAGMATPIGSLPNLVAIEALRSQGRAIDFLTWMSFGIPVSLVLVVGIYMILRLRLPVSAQIDKTVERTLKAEVHALGNCSCAEWWTAGAFLFAVVLWLLPSLSQIVFPAAVAAAIDARLDPSTAVLLAVLPLFIVRPRSQEKSILEGGDLAKIDWSTVLLFAGGLTLGSVVNATGIVSTMATLIGSLGTWGALFGIVVLAIGLSELSSNTTAAAILVPLVLSATLQAPESMVVVTVLACGFGFLLPISTPPNAIVYGTGKVPLRDMMRNGALLDLLGILMLPLVGYYFLPLVLNP